MRLVKERWALGKFTAAAKRMWLALVGAGTWIIIAIAESYLDRFVSDDAPSATYKAIRVADDWLSEHYLWVISAMAVTYAVAAYRSIVREQSSDIAKSVHVDRPFLFEDTGEDKRINLAFNVFNGSTRPISIAYPGRGYVVYGDREFRSIHVVVPKTAIEPGSIGSFNVYLSLGGPVGEEVAKDLEAGQLKDIYFRHTAIFIVDGDERRRLELPDGVKCIRKEGWTVGQILLLGEVDFSLFILCALALTST